MDKLERIKSKLTKVEALLSEIRRELDGIRSQEEPQPKLPKLETQLPSESELRERYDALYTEFLANGNGAVEAFVTANGKPFLQAFSRANSLSVDPKKASKAKVINEIVQCMMQRKAITQKAK